MTGSINGLRCWDELGRLTFDINIQTVRSTIVMTIPSGASGSIPLSSLPDGLEGVRFIPVLSSVSQIAPFTWVEPIRFYWGGGKGAHYLTGRNPIIRKVPSGTSGSIDLSSLPTGIAGVNFIPVIRGEGAAHNIEPRLWVVNKKLQWGEGVGDYYLACRDHIIQTIPSEGSGSIQLSALPEGFESAGFVPIDYNLESNLEPKKWTAGPWLSWRGSSGDHYLSVVDISGLGGSLAMDEDST